MRVEHGRGDILVAKPCLDSTHIRAGFQQMRGPCMPHAMTARHRGEARLPHRLFHGSLPDEPPHVMPPFDAGSGVDRAFGRGEDVWPVEQLRTPLSGPVRGAV
jgi:hypothetical protein